MTTEGPQGGAGPGEHRAGPAIIVAPSVPVMTLVMTFVLVACGRIQDPTSEARSGTAPPRREATVVHAASATPPVPFVTDDSVVRPDGGNLSLAGQAIPSFSAYLSPAAVPSPDGRFIAYNAWADLVAVDPERSWSQLGVEAGDPVGTPSIRLIDLRSGRDVTLEEGAYSIAWRSDGAVAYVRGVERDYRANVQYLGQVVVRASLEAAPEIWTKEEAHYVVYGWAGDSVLVYRVGEGEELDVFALDGPGEARPLASRARIIAVAPDGTRAIVAVYDRRTIEVLDVRTGQRLERLDLMQVEPAQTPPIVDVLYAGSWAADLVAAVVTLADGSTGLALLRVSDVGLDLSSVLTFPAKLLPMGIAEPQLLAPAGSRVIAVAPLPGKGEAAGTVYAYLDCDLEAGSCAKGPTITDRAFHPIYNPSRPSPETVADG